MNDEFLHQPTDPRLEWLHDEYRYRIKRCYSAIETNVLSQIKDAMYCGLVMLKSWDRANLDFPKVNDQILRKAIKACLKKLAQLNCKSLRTNQLG